MWKLAIIFYIIIGPTLAGFGALVPLTIYGVNDFNALFLIGSAAAGALLAAPASYLVARRVTHLMQPAAWS
ncbi:MAG: hypothetical protein JJ902_21695 [Roseibium sp.]|nr:hypothetical protein [Roseibium sp.]